MGAWDMGAFGNDDACDWVYELEESEGLEFIEQTLDAVIAVPAHEFLEASSASCAVAAAETIAALQGNTDERAGYTESLEDWLKANKRKPPKALAAKAHKALDRILANDSELRALWAESGAEDEWREMMENLRSRVKLD